MSASPILTAPPCSDLPPWALAAVGSEFFVVNTNAKVLTSAAASPPVLAYDLYDIVSGQAALSELTAAPTVTGAANIIPVAVPRGMAWLDVYHIYNAYTAGGLDPTTPPSIRAFGFVPARMAAPASVGMPGLPRDSNSTAYPTYPKGLWIPLAGVESDEQDSAFSRQFFAEAKVVRSVGASATDRFRMSGHQSFYTRACSHVAVTVGVAGVGASASAGQYGHASVVAMLIARWTG